MSHFPVSRFPVWPYFALAVLAVAADQLTKILVLAYIPFQTRLPVISGFFDLTHVYNPGAAFSFLADAGGWQKYFFTAFAVLVCLYLGRNILKREFRGLSAWAAAMIMGGAVGNVTDRLLYGHVVDFLLVYWRNYYYPAFNIADSFICVGAALFVLAGIQEARREKRRQAT
ncbi:MAG: signal peptidase II [Eikenella sp.]|nr:signal peptidase II [Eikenella sp.]